MVRLFVVVTLLSCTSATLAQEASDVTIGKRLVLHSKMLDENRPYSVHLPESYEGTTQQRYPVLYLLDGDVFFDSTVGIVEYMGKVANLNLQIPEFIVVAIPSSDRERDLTPTHREVVASSGGADKFLSFVQDELFRKIESTYRTLPYRVVVGHSLGGLLALHALVKAPELFQAYIAIDPSLWWDNQEIVARAARQLTALREVPGTVFISLANYEDKTDVDLQKHTNAIRSFERILESVASPNFRSQVEFFESEDHVSVPLMSLYRGLLYIFEGYKPSIDSFLEQPGTVSSHFEGISKRLGVTLLPPERLMNRLGSISLHGMQDPAKAVEFFELGVSSDPGAWEAYDRLGEAYMALGKRRLAIDNFEKAHELNPGNEEIAGRVKQARESALVE